MTPASEIIERCGGLKVVAKWTGMTENGVQRWVYRGNAIPMQRWAEIIQLARSLGKPISLEELMPDDVARIARESRRKRAA